MARLLEWAQAAVFVTLGCVAVVRWRRRGEAGSGWLAALFAVLALAIAVSSSPLLPEAGHGAHVPVRRLLGALIAALPYLHYRFLVGFAEPRRAEHRAVTAVTAGLVAGTLAVPGFPAEGQPFSLPFTVLVSAVVAQWIVVVPLVAVRLWRGARAQPAAAGARLRTLAAGSLTLTAGVVLSLAGSAGLLSPGFALDAVALASGLILLGGFAPPPLLRALWRRRAEEDSVQVTRALMTASSPEDVGAACVTFASALFGGRGAVLVGDNRQLLGAHGLGADEAGALAAELAGSRSSGTGGGHRDAVLAVACGGGWLAVKAGAPTPLFGGPEADRLRAIAMLAELALERVVLNAQVHRSHRQLLEAQEIAHVGSWEWDIGGDTVTWSEELYRMHGLRPRSAGLRYADVLATVHSADQAAFEQAVQTSCSSGQPFELEHRVVHPDGTVALLHARGKIVADQHGRPLRLVGACQDVTERRRLEQEVIRRALHDPLTDLANRALFTERLGHALTRCERVGAPLAVLFIDLDDFKAVNDTLGHAAGDELLQAVAASLETLVRSADTVARLGGDEFGILLEDTGQCGATALTERILAVLAEPRVVQGRELVTRASVGIVVDPGSSSAAELLRNADSAMYAAKGAGKDGYRVFERAMHAELSRRLELRSDLQDAVAAGQLHLAYQPVVRLLDGKVTAVEALLRWDHPTRGALDPAEFVPLAEESGLIVDVGDWVLREAVGQLRAWQDVDPSLGALGLHVNVSARQLRQAGSVERVAEVLADAGVDPALLTIEITESVLLGESDASVAQLRALRQLGARVAIDDFGTGYSSLSYLKRLPIDTLKIDRSFVDGVTRGPEEEALAHAIVRIAGTLRLGTVAEGVETPAQARRLLAMGCAAGQGFLYAPALSADALLELLAGRPRTIAAGGV